MGVPSALALARYPIASSCPCVTNITIHRIAPWSEVNVTSPHTLCLLALLGCSPSPTVSPSRSRCPVLPRPAHGRWPRFLLQPLKTPRLLLMAGAQCATGPRAAPPLLVLLLCGFLCVVLVLLAPAARHGDDDETEEFPVTSSSSSWPTAAARSSSWRPRPRPRGRWNYAGQGLQDSKHEVPSGPNPDSNR